MAIAFRQLFQVMNLSGWNSRDLEVKYENKKTGRLDGSCRLSTAMVSKKKTKPTTDEARAGQLVFVVVFVFVFCVERLLSGLQYLDQTLQVQQSCNLGRRNAKTLSRSPARV
jgi:hypothetical protein